jgi:hypothetical protein
MGMDVAQIQSMALVRDLVHGRWKAQALSLILQLRIPQLLEDGPRTLVSLADQLEVSEDGLGRLMNVMVALGLFARDDQGRLTNNDASALLTADNPASLRLDALHTLSPSMGICWDNLEYAVRHGTSGFEHAMGQSVFSYLQDRPAEADVTHAFQAQVTRWNVPGLLATGFFPETGKVVDVGGGNGTTLVELLRQRPGLQGILYDLPDAVERARTIVAAAGLTDRIELREGDFFATVPSGGNLYLLSHVLHDWPDGRAVEIVRAVGAAMGPDSELLVVELAKPKDGGSWVMAYLDLLVLVGLGGRERTADEYRGLVERAGLSVIREAEAGPKDFSLGIVLARCPRDVPTTPRSPDQASRR